MKRLGLILLLLGSPVTLLAQDFAISGAEVHTMARTGVLENATIVVRNGVIVAVGQDADVPASAERIDATGKIVTPGLFSPLGRIGVTEVSAVDGTVDNVQRGDEFTASFDIADAYNPRSTLVPVSRIEGITRAAITPEADSPDVEGNRSHVISGLGAIVNLGDDGDPLTKRAAMLVVNFGETGGELAGGSRAAALLALRTALDDALDYAGHRAEFETGDRRAYSVSRADLEALQDIIEGRVPVLASADRASDIRALLGLADDYRLRLIIAGGAEAWLLADELAAAGAGVILSAVNNLPGSFETLGARLDTGARLEAAGVPVTFGLDRNMQTHNARNLTQAAGIAVANGLSWETALRAITLTPAELYGVDDRVGSIEVGKEADLVVWSQDPLELTSYPEQVYIRGRAVPMESRQTMLRDRYLDGDAERPPAFRR